MRNIFYSLVMIGVDVVIMINLFMFFEIQFQPFNQGVNYWDYNSYYFGFKSIINWLQDIPSDLNINTFASILTEFVNVTLGLNLADIESTNIVDVLTAMLFGPMKALLYVIVDIARLLKVLIGTLTWLYSLFSGKYNIPLVNTPQSDIQVDSTFLNPDWWRETSSSVIEFLVHSTYLL